MRATAADAAGRRYVPAPASISIELDELADVRDALTEQGSIWARNAMEDADAPDGRVEIESALGHASTAANLLRVALAVEDARVDAEARPGRARRR